MPPREALPPHLRHSGDKRANNSGPSYKPDQQTRELVYRLAPLLKVEEICAIIGISMPTLYKYYKETLAEGRAAANAVVGNLIFKQIVAGNVDLMKFWAARKMGWVEQKVVPPAEEDDLSEAGLEALQQELRELQERRRIAGMAEEIVGGKAEAAE